MLSLCRKHLFLRILFCTVTFGCLLHTEVIADPASLLSNGDFEASHDGSKPDDWPIGANILWQSEGQNHFLRLKSPAPGANVTAYRAVTLQPGVQALELSYRVRFEGIKRGKESWYDGRIMLNFKDAAGKVVQPSPSHPNFTGSSSEWKQRSQQFKVPAGAAKLELIFALFNAESGQIDFDDVRLVAIPASVVDAAEAAARTKEAARIAALPKPAPQVPVPEASALPPPLHVEGNQLKTPDGKAVWLQGLAVPSMEWSAGGENVLKSIETGITGWKANCIRLCLGSKFYEGHGPWQNDGGLKYRQLVEDAVNLCGGHGAYIVLDLHEYRAPTEQHAAFWKVVAEHYKNQPAVIFELLNEPHDISWEIWQKGGQVTDQKSKTDAAAENQDSLSTFRSIGMQGLVDAIRSTGARNLIIAGGLDWGYDLSGITAGHALSDEHGNGIMYSSHVYPWKRDWQGKFLDAAAQYPVFVGEVGADSKPMDFIPLKAQEDPATWVPDMLGVIQKYKLNWTAWSFHPSANPRVLLDWNYTPTPFWGEHVKAALSGREYTVSKLR